MEVNILKKQDKVIVAVMVIVGVIALCIYIPPLIDYGTSRTKYNQLRDKYTTSVTESAESAVEEDIPTESIEESEEIPENAIVSTSSDVPEELDELSSVTTTKDAAFPNARYLEKEKDFTPILKKISKEYKKLQKISVKHNELLKENKDYIGWIYVPETSISYPVVKSKDNKDYLRKAFDGSSSNSGSIFLDANCKDLLEEHPILYGHNMRDKSMFATLNSFVTDKDFVKEHPVFWFMTNDRICLYQVFSAHKCDPDDRDIFGSQTTDYRTRQRWMEAVDKMKEKSVFESDVDVAYGDQVMTLSTCTSARVDRAVIHGKMIAYSGKK